MDVIATDPEFQRVSVALFRAGLPLTYGPFYRRLGLSAEKISALEALMVERQIATNDIMAAARTQGLSLTDPILRRAADDNHQSFNEKIRNLLGNNDYQQLMIHMTTTNARTSVDTLAANLYYTNSPLTLDQADRLTTIVAEQTEKRAPTGMIGSLGQTNWENVIAQSGHILAPDQIAVLRLLGERIKLQREYSDIASRLTDAAVKKN